MAVRQDQTAGPPGGQPSYARHGPAGRLLIAGLVAGLIATALAVYQPHLRDAFALDDYIWLRAASSPDAVRFFRRAISFPAWTPYEAPTPFWRPLVDTWFFLGWRIFGDHPLGYHLANVLLHAANAALVGWLAWRLARSRLAAVLAAWLFLLWPSYDFAVTWISSATELLGSLCSMAAVVLWVEYLRAPRGRRRLYGGTLAAVVLALLAKESAAVLPAVLGLLALALRPPRQWREVRRLALEMAPTAALTLAYAAFLFVHEYRTLSAFAVYSFDPHAVVNLWNYLRRLTLPLDLERASRVSPLQSAAAAAFLLGGAAAAVRSRIAGVVWAWVLFALLPYSFFVGGIEFRYTYLASLPFAILLAMLSAAAVDGLRRLAGRRVTLAAALPLAICLAVMLAAETRSRQTWIAEQAEAYGTMDRAVTRLCGELPPGSTVTLVDAPVFDLYGDSVRMALNLRYERVDVERMTAAELPPAPAEAGMCTIRFVDGSYLRVP